MSELQKATKSSANFVARTNLDVLNMSFLRKGQIGKGKFRAPKFVLLGKGTNSEHLNLSHIKKDKFKPSKFVLHASRTNLDHLNQSF